MTDRFENDETHALHPEWIVESRCCPFDDLPARFCGCPEGDRLETLRMQHYDGMGSE